MIAFPRYALPEPAIAPDGKGHGRCWWMTGHAGRERIIATGGHGHEIGGLPSRSTTCVLRQANLRCRTTSEAEDSGIVAPASAPGLGDVGLFNPLLKVLQHLLECGNLIFKQAHSELEFFFT